MNEDRLNSLLLVWQEQQSQGRDVQPAELCHDCPELVDDLNERVQVLRRINALMRPGSAPFDATDVSVTTPTSGGSAELSASSCSAPAPLSIPGHEILGELGRGGMGIVYRAREHKRAQMVALKTLQGMNAAALARFKQEFRALADVAHPNLVNLHELISDGQHWCFTMELVEGVDFHAFVRDGGEDKDMADAGASTAGLALTEPQLARLRMALAQLSEAVHALHQGGKLHRDLKRSNVMVTNEGRVVVLDFGLIADIEEDGVHHTGQVVGTVAYMSPEQGAGKPVSPATDWYSIGVMLYEALTGRLPFQGSVFRILSDKQAIDPPDPRKLEPTTPEDLNQLCVDLLKRDPERRPSGQEVLARLRGKAGHSWKIGSRTSSLPRHGGTLFGRDRHRQLLDEAYQSMARGRTVLVRVHGPSGVGKSVLVQSFLDSLSHGHGAVILAGRCYQQESVPYKALDTVVDSLGRYLKGLPAHEAQALLPRDMTALSRLFPVLAEIEVGTVRRAEIPDARELRRRAFAALRELLARIGARRPLVLAIDDLQWGDIDSAALLPELFQSPDPPVLLLVASFRSEEAAGSSFLKTFFSALAVVGSELDQREVQVEPLSPTEAKDLALALLGGTDSAVQAQADNIAREADGNPLFTYELVQHLKSQGDCQPGASGAEPRLDEVLWARVCRLLAEPFDKAIACGSLPPVIIAAPDGSIQGKPTFLNSASFFANSHAGRFEDFIIDDVWDFMTENFPIRPEREAHALIGISMGGTAAFNLGMKYQERFYIVLGYMPALNLRWIDCHERYKGKFDPNCWKWRTRLRPHEEIGRFYGIVSVKFKDLSKPLFGRGPGVLDELSEINPIEVMERVDLQPGQLAMYIAYAGRDQFNIDAQVNSFLYMACQRGIEIPSVFDPQGKHDMATGLRMFGGGIDFLSQHLPQGTPLVQPHP